MNPSLPSPIHDDQVSEPALLEQLLAGDDRAYRHLMVCNNQRLFRTARAFVASDAEAEDIVQDAYVHAFEHLGKFRGSAALSTWLVRIVVNEARQRLRDRKGHASLEAMEAEPRSTLMVSLSGNEDPVETAARSELRAMLEHAIGALSPRFRSVFVLRELEECSIEETAQLLGLRAETVKTRLHRARRALRSVLEQRVEGSLKEAFHFQGLRCAQITDRVMRSLRVRELLNQRRPASGIGQSPRPAKTGTADSTKGVLVT